MKAFLRGLEEGMREKTTRWSDFPIGECRDKFDNLTGLFVKTKSNKFPGLWSCSKYVGSDTCCLRPSDKIRGSKIIPARL